MKRQGAGVVALMLFLECVQGSDVDLLVHTKLGDIRGLKSEDGDYFMFLGIPYALVNSSNPFGDSLRHPKFNETYQAANDDVMCPQIEEFSGKYAGSLDCLRLNIYVPTVRHEKNIPVMFYIHGGNFLQGTGGRHIYGPAYLVRHSVIVVTINYRLGPYGYLCTDRPEVPGNQALKDQYAALEWTKDHIGSFGGDPEMITIDGHSSGSVSVDYHLMTRRPKLYRQAIIQSGSSFYPDALLPVDYAVPLKIAKNLGHETDDTTEAIAFLATAHPESVLNASKTFLFRMCTEKKHEGVSRFISEHPERSDAPRVHDVNILAGFTNNEWLLGLYGEAFKFKFETNIINTNINLLFDLDHLDRVGETVRRFYMGEKEMGEPTKYKTVDFMSDFQVIYPIQRSVAKYLNHRNVRVYMYFFTYDGGRNLIKRMYNMTEGGASHADELSYLFDVDTFRDDLDAGDRRMIDVMTTLWTNFAKYGNPTPRTSNLIPVTWPRLTAHAQQYLRIDSNLSVIHRPYHQRMAFWDLFFNAYHNKIRT